MSDVTNEHILVMSHFVDDTDARVVGGDAGFVLRGGYGGEGLQFPVGTVSVKFAKRYEFKPLAYETVSTHTLRSAIR